MATIDIQRTMWVSDWYEEPATQEQLTEIFRYAAILATTMNDDVVVVTQGGVKLTFGPQT